MDKYSLDKNYLKDLINKGEQLLKSNISINKKNILKKEIKTLNNFIHNNYEVNEDESSTKYKFIELKNQVLEKMKTHYKQFGIYLIEWILDLYNSNIIKESNYLNMTNLSTEEQEEYTLKNYEKNSSIFYNEAKKLFFNNISYIQEIEEFDYSKCYYSNLAKSSFIFVNPNETPWILNHESAHYIENKLKTKTPYLYKELSPIYFEMLFNEYLYEKQGYLMKGDYEERIDNVYLCLKSIYSYFKTLLIFSKTNFIVSNNNFKKTILENYKDDPTSDNNLYYNINYDILNGNIEECMKYLFSFLKSIELYFTKSNYNDKINILEPYINRDKFIFQIPNDYALYERYVKELKIKRKK